MGYLQTKGVKFISHEKNYCIDCLFIFLTVLARTMRGNIEKRRKKKPDQYGKLLFCINFSLNFPNNPMKLLFHTHYKDEEIDYQKNLKISRKKCQKNSRAD